MVAVQPSPWPAFVIAVRTEVLLGRTAEVGTVIDAVVAEANALHQRPDVAHLIADRYGLAADTVDALLAATRFAPRGAVDPALAPGVLAIMEAAGIT